MHALMKRHETMRPSSRDVVDDLFNKGLDDPMPLQHSSKRLVGKERMRNARFVALLGGKGRRAEFPSRAVACVANRPERRKKWSLGFEASCDAVQQTGNSGRRSMQQCVRRERSGALNRLAFAQRDHDETRACERTKISSAAAADLENRSARARAQPFDEREG